MDEVAFLGVCKIMLFSVLTNVMPFASFCLCNTCELCEYLIKVTETINRQDYIYIEKWYEECGGSATGLLSHLPEDK